MSTQQKLHLFCGKWITDDEFFKTPARNVFSRQLQRLNLDCSLHRDRHILFRKLFACNEAIKKAVIYISADDYYKLYINGQFVAQGPAASYHHIYNYNEIDVSEYLKQGENLIAVHTLYQGLINRVWQSGDNRHGLIFDLEVNGHLAICSDETVKTAVHSAYKEIGTFGCDTGFLEEYDSRAAEVGFEKPTFDDSSWMQAKLSQTADHTLLPQKTKMLTFEKIFPVKSTAKGNIVFLDFGSTYAGSLYAKVRGNSGDKIIIHMGQELNEDDSVRYNLRANCIYEESWILSDGICELEQFDYKAFRYAELILPEECEVQEVFLLARHYPFELKAELKDIYKQNADIANIWQLCVNTQKYGVQEAVLDCMEREKGEYLGDGCYTALTHMILTNDDSIARKLIDNAFTTDFIADTLITCLNCSFIQEIAEFPLMLVKLILWHFRYTGDTEYLRENYTKVINLLEAYRKNYEKDFLISNLDKWCVVEWPDHFRDGYDVDIGQGQICTETHIAINAYYIEAIKTANKMAKELGYSVYRDDKLLIKAFVKAFYVPEKHLFKDGIHTEHISMIGNIFPFAFELCPDDACKEQILQIIKNRNIHSVSLFGAFPLLEGLVRQNKEELILQTICDPGAWLRMLNEGATTTFESWGKDTKSNASLFHMTLSYAAVFLADINLNLLFK